MPLLDAYNNKYIFTTTCLQLRNGAVAVFFLHALKKILLWLLHLRTCTLSWICAVSLECSYLPYSVRCIFLFIRTSFLSLQILSSLPQQWLAARWAPGEPGSNLLSSLQGSTADLISHSQSPGGLTSPCTLMLHGWGCRLVSHRFFFRCFGTHWGLAILTLQY